MSKSLTINNQTISSLVDSMKSQIQLALPRHMTVDRFARIAITEFKNNPSLMNCDASSFLGCLMTCAQLGVEPGKSLGHAYIIPYRSQNGLQATFILGYRGMIDLARRSGQIISLSAHEVYEEDLFEYEFGINEKLVHKPSNTERTKMTYAYAIARLNGGGYQMDVMSKNDIDMIRNRSKASGSGPWVTDYSEMAKKTVVRRLFKYLPISIEIQRAITIDEAADRGEQKDYFDYDFNEDLNDGKEEKKSVVDEIIEEIGK